DADEYL
nr:Chain B, EGFR receptor fragment [Homo sapiens]